MALLVVFVSSCDIEEEPKSLDKGPYVGCYEDGGVIVKLSSAEMLVNGKSFSYKIQFRKVGYIISSHFVVNGYGSGVRISNSKDERFYRFVVDGGALKILLTDGDGHVYKLKRAPSC